MPSNPQALAQDNGKEACEEIVQESQERSHTKHDRQDDQRQVPGFLPGGPTHFAQLSKGFTEEQLNPVEPARLSDNFAFFYFGHVGLLHASRYGQNAAPGDGVALQAGQAGLEPTTARFGDESSTN